MQYKAECQYCGKIWEVIIYYSQPKINCMVCKDKNVKLKPISIVTGDIFGYDHDKRKDAYVKPEESYD